MPEEKRTFYKSFDAKSKQITDRLTKAFKNNTNKCVIQCTWPIHASDVQDIYFVNFTVGLSLEEFVKPDMTQKRLTPTAKKEMWRIEERNQDYNEDYGMHVKLGTGMTRAIFSKDESYYRRRIMSVKYSNIKKDLKLLLQTHLIANLVTIVFQF